jgi:hypothetical protein
MNYIYIAVAVIILLIICYFLFMRKRKIIKQKQIELRKKDRVSEKIPLPIYAYDSNKNLVYVGDINDLERRDNREIVDLDDVLEDEVYFNTQDHELEYKGKIEDLKPRQNNLPIAKDYFYLLSNHTNKETNVNCYIIYVAQKK